MNTEIEIWKDVKDYEGIYKVSNLGNVKSINRVIYWRKKYIIKKGIDLKLINRKGYLYVGLHNDNICKLYSVHRLVAIAFIPNPENKPQVNHINGIKTDNRVNNLEWNTGGENQKHAYKNKLKKAVCGEKNHNAKLNEKNIIEIRKSNLNNYILANIYSVCHQTISRIKRKEIWKHV